MLEHVRRLLLAGASTAVLAGPSMAADLGMPVKAPPQALPPSWTGPYAGLHVGWIGHRASVDELAFGFSSLNTRMSMDGFIGGGHAGYNWQYQAVVLGVEGDISGATGSRTVAYGTPGLPDTFTSKLAWLSTIRGRVGFAYDQWLIYGTAGWAIAGVDNARTDPLGPFTLDKSETKAGIVWGGGIEHRFASNWTARIEAFHVDLGHSTYSTVATNGTYITRFTNEATVVRGGVSFKW